MRNALWAAGIALAAISAAPAADSATSGPPHHASRVHVRIENMKFVPDSLEIAAGDTVEWDNEDLFGHTATALGGAFNSKEIPAGKTWKHVFRKKGIFPYICALHPVMKATLIVR